MAIDLKYWKKKYPNVEQAQLVDWLSDMSLKDLSSEDEEEYIRRRAAGEDTNDLTDLEEENYPEIEDDDIPEAELEPIPDEEKVADYLMSNPQAKKEFLRAVENKEDMSALGAKIGAQAGLSQEEESFLEAARKQQTQERHTNNEPDIPFTNPDLSDIEVPEEEDFYDDEEDLLESLPKEPLRHKAPLMRQEMINRTISVQEYENLIKPFAPIFADIRKEGAMINKLAQQIDINNLPPYMQIKPYIINHDIKDINKTSLILYVVSEANALRLEKKYVPLSQANDVTRVMAEQDWYDESFDNYDTIIEKLIEDRTALVSLIYILENYCEAKQTSPFELSIPKKLLMESVEQSFDAIKEMITNNVIKEMSTLRKDLQGEMIDVGTVVEKNMTRFDTQIQEAVTKVLWKVKTDVESTNLEDIKKSILFCINKRNATYTLGGVATSIMTVLIDDLELRLIEEQFMLENIKEYNKYTVADLTKRLGYKTASPIIKNIPKLLSRKLIKLYQNKTISL